MQRRVEIEERAPPLSSTLQNTDQEESSSAPDSFQPAPAASTQKKPRKKRGHGAWTKTKFSFRHGDHEYAAVPIPRHKNNKAFKQYVTKKNYPEEIVESDRNAKHRRNDARSSTWSQENVGANGEEI